jgi:hypothetical protein
MAELALGIGGVQNEGDGLEAPASALAAEGIQIEHAAEELSPWDPRGSAFRRVAALGRRDRRHDLSAIWRAGGEDAELPAEGEAGSGQDGREAGEELERRHHERGAAAAIRPLQAVDDHIVIASREALEAQRGAQQVADEALQRRAIAGLDDQPSFTVMRPLQ